MNATTGVSGADTAPGPASHRVFARFWARLSGTVGSDRQRSELLSGLAGRVLEVGAGDGRNFRHYPEGVERVVAIEPEPYLRRLAVRAAAASRAPIEVRDGAAELLPGVEGSYDAVVSSLVLCSVTDQERALGEIARVLRDGGELRFFEHVRADGVLGRTLQHGLDESGIWPCLGGGCHLTRETLAAIEGAGFTVERVRRFSSGPGSLGVPFVLGAARRPARQGARRSIDQPPGPRR